MVPWITDKPWEFAFDRNRKTFLATEELHFVRNAITSVPAQKLIPTSGPLRILVAAAQPVGTVQLLADQEEADVDVVGGEVRIARAISGGRVETPKSGKARSVDMSVSLRDVLQQHDTFTKAEALKAGTDRPVWVFPSLEGTPLDRGQRRERPSSGR